MVQGKTQMKRIENRASRHVSFSKRRRGLFKKAYELSLLCDAEVAVIVFSSTGRLFEFANANMRETVGHYMTYTNGNIGSERVLQDIEKAQADDRDVADKLEALEAEKRKLLGEKLEECSAQELDSLEAKLAKSLRSIRERKIQLFKEQLTKLTQQIDMEQERKLLKCRGDDLTLGLGTSAPPTTVAADESNDAMDVETELSIGLPGMSDGSSKGGADYSRRLENKTAIQIMIDAERRAALHAEIRRCSEWLKNSSVCSSETMEEQRSGNYC